LNERHILYAKAIDKAGNIQNDVYKSSEAFWFQGNMPESGITKPKEGVYYNKELNGLTSIEGTAQYADAADGIKIRLQRMDTYECWEAAPADVWRSSTSFEWNSKNVVAGSWSLSIDTNAWTDGLNYKVTSKGYSGAMGDELDYDVKVETNKNFTMDLSGPLCAVSFPAAGSYHDSIPQLAGAASDTGAGIKNVDFKLVDNTSGEFWDISASTWAAPLTWSTAAYAAGAWTVDNLPEWIHGRTYSLQPRAYDNINEGIADFNETVGTQITFTYDIVAPTCALTSPSDGSYPSALSVITGTVVDEFPILKILLQIKNKGTTTYWRAVGGWSTSEQWISTQSAAGVWDYNTGTIGWNNGVKYEIRAKAVDVAGSTSAVVLSTIIFDNQPPYSIITQPAVSYTDDILTIGGNAGDATAGISDGSVMNYRHIGRFRYELPAGYYRRR
jgi:hypothetical protein